VRTITKQVHNGEEINNNRLNKEPERLSYNKLRYSIRINVT